MNDLRVLHGDAFDLLGSIAPRTVDLVITRPYWGMRTYGLPHDEGTGVRWRATGGSDEPGPDYAWYRAAGGVLGMEPIPGWFVRHLVEIFEQMIPTLKPTASVWVNLGDTYFSRGSGIREQGRRGLAGPLRRRRYAPTGGFRHEKQLLLVPAKFAISMQDAGWILRNDMIWAKPNPTPDGAHDRLTLSHEHLFHFVRRTPGRRPTYYYDRTRAEPSARDVVEVAVSPGVNGHTATFPADLIRPRILSSSPPDGVVLDPFCGTGRALELAVEAGRRAIGIELSPAFFDGASALIARRGSG